MYNTSNGKAIAPSSGDYEIKATVPLYRSTGTSDQLEVRLNVNASDVYTFGTFDTSNSGGALDTFEATLNVFYSLNAGDVVLINMVEVSGSPY